MRSALLLAILSGCMIPLGRNLNPMQSPRYVAEKQAAAQMEPVRLGEPRSYATVARRLKLRIWVDEGYQRRVNWRRHVAEVIERVNAYLGPSFGVTLEADIRGWDRGGDPEGLVTVLDALVAQDPGDDVDHVVGLTGSLAVASVDHHELGIARHPGKHFVLRAMNGAEELRRLKEWYPTLGEKERIGLLERRNAHKEVAVFVHEWAHNYGVRHEEGGPSIMGAGYDNRAGGMSEPNARQLAGALAGAPRQPEPPEAAPDDSAAIADADARGARGQWAEALAALDGLAAGIPDKDSARRLAVGQAYDRLGAFTRAEAALAQHPEARERAVLRRRQHGIHGVAPEREPEATATVELAHQALADDNPDGAGRLADAGLRHFPDLPGLLALRCGSLLHRGQLRAAERACERAIARWPETVFAHLFLGEVHRLARRAPPAIAAFERALALDPDLRSAYASLAELYAETGDRARLQALRSAYLARFGRSLE